MAEYRVIWEIDVEADDALDAAGKAREIQLDPRSTALVFKVHPLDAVEQQIDLMNPGA